MNGNDPQLGGKGQDNSPMLSRLVREKALKKRAQAPLPVVRIFFSICEHAYTIEPTDLTILTLLREFDWRVEESSVDPNERDNILYYTYTGFIPGELCVEPQLTQQIDRLRQIHPIQLSLTYAYPIVLGTILDTLP